MVDVTSVRVNIPCTYITACSDTYCAIIFKLFYYIYMQTFLYTVIFIRIMQIQHLLTSYTYTYSVYYAVLSVQANILYNTVWFV